MTFQKVELSFIEFCLQKQDGNIYSCFLPPRAAGKCCHLDISAYINRTSADVWTINDQVFHLNVHFESLYFVKVHFHGIKFNILLSSKSSSVS